MMNPPALPPRSDWERRLPLLLSAFVLPGAGQFLQRRRAAGIAWALAFVVCLAMVLASALGPLAATYRAALAFAESGANQEFVRPDLGRLLGWTAAALLVYVLNVVDVVAAARRTPP